jgi:hypothetical protein
MQQAILAQDESPLSVPTATVPPAKPRPANAFVINLCSSTTPVVLTPPDHAGLKRFIFFISRRREENRERFRLHMGYFESQEEAEKLLDIVREIYPGAWAGLAPGHRLRAQAQGAQAQGAQAQGSQAQAAANVELPASTPVARRASAPVPTAAAAAPAAAPLAIAAPADAPAAAPAVAPAAVPSAAHAMLAAPEVQAAPALATGADGETALPAELSLLPDAGRQLPSGSAEVGARGSEAARSLNNVRSAIAALEEPTTTAPTLRAIPELSAAQALNDTGVLRLLEGTARDQAAVLSQPSAPAPLRPAMPPGAVQRPASEPLREGAEARPRDEKAQFAVQLMWSVKPIDIAQVPRLAIFSAYTLYGAEGNRDGRRWYGIRLGFFTDAVSAKQVAHYVRSDFATVSVVPVTVRERERARLAATRPIATPATPSPAAGVAAAPTPDPAHFEFIDDRKRTPEGAAFRGDGSPMPRQPKGAAGASRPTRGAPGKRAKLRAGVTPRVQARAATKPMTLEETLEILGAGELQVDDGRKALINDSGVRHLQLETAKRGKSSRLGRLFERLSDRLGT